MAITFDEVDDRYTIADDAGLTLPAGDWCIGFWAKVDDNSGSLFKYAFSNNGYGVANSINIWLLEASEPGDANKWAFRLEDGSANDTGIVLSSTAPGGDGLWRLIVLQRDTTAGEFQLWFCEANGTANKQASASDTGYGAINGGAWYLGCRSDLDGDRFFGGTLAEFFAGSFALSSAEMATLATVTTPSTPYDLGDNILSLGKTPTVYFNMLTAGGTLEDASGNGHDATRTSVPTTATHPIDRYKLNIAATQVAANTSTGNQTITAAKLYGQTPKAALFIISRATANGTAVGTAAIGVGATDGTNEWVHSTRATDGLGTTDTTRGRFNTACVSLFNTNATPTYEAVAEFVSFTPNSVTINWTTAPASGRLLMVVLLAGTGLNVEAGSYNLGSTVNATQTITTGFQTDVVLGMGVAANTETTGTGSGVISLGAAVSGKQRSVSIADYRNSPTSVLANYYSAQYINAFTLNSASEIGLTSTGFTITARVGASTTREFGYLALALPEGYAADLRTITAHNASTTVDITTSQRGLFTLFGMSTLDTVDTVDTTGKAGAIGLGVATAPIGETTPDVYSVSYMSEDGVSTSNTESLADTNLTINEDDGTAGFSNTATFDATDGYSLSWDASTIGYDAKWWALHIGYQPERLVAADEGLSVGDAGAYFRNLRRILDESQNVEEVISRLGALLRLVTDTVQVGTAINWLKAMRQTIAETVQVGESVSRFRALLQWVGETVQVDDVISRLMALVRVTDRTVQIGETGLRVTGLLKAIADTVQLSTAGLKFRGLIRFISETVELNNRQYDVDDYLPADLNDVTSQTLGVYDSRYSDVYRSLSEKNADGYFALRRGASPYLLFRVTFSTFSGIAGYDGYFLWVNDLGGATVGLIFQKATYLGGGNMDFTTLDSWAVPELASNDWLGVMADGDTFIILIWRNGDSSWEVIDTVTDSTYTTGSPDNYMAAGAGVLAASDMKHLNTVPTYYYNFYLLTLLRFGNEVVQVATERLRFRTLRRLLTEVVQIDESTPRLRAFWVAVSETVNLVTDGRWVRGLYQFVADVIQTSTAGRYVIGLIALVAETVQVSETAQRLRGFLRSVGETVQVSEDSFIRKAIVRVQTEILRILETNARSRTMTRRLTEVVQIDTVAARLREMVRQVNDALNISETRSPILGLVRLAADTVQIGTVPSALRGLVKRIADSVQISEDTARSRALIRFLDDTVQIRESLIRARALLRAVADTVQISEVAGRLRDIIAVVVDERIEVSETRSQIRGLVRRIAETVQVSENLFYLRGLLGVIGEQIQVSETVSRIRQLVRAIGEYELIRTSIARLRGLQRRSAETVQVTETTSHRKSIRQLIAEVIHISEIPLGSAILYTLANLSKTSVAFLGGATAVAFLVGRTAVKYLSNRTGVKFE